MLETALTSLTARPMTSRLKCLNVSYTPASALSSFRQTSTGIQPVEPVFLNRRQFSHKANPNFPLKRFCILAFTIKYTSVRHYLDGHEIYMPWLIPEERRLSCTSSPTSAECKRSATRLTLTVASLTIARRGQMP